MAVSKLSAIAASGSNLVAADQLVGVNGGTTDLLFSGTQIKNFITGGGTLAITAAKTLTVSNTLTLTATDGSTLAIGTGGTLGTNAYTSTAYLPLAGGTVTGTIAMSGAGISYAGAISAAAWTTTGLLRAHTAATLTDTSSSGTVAAAYTNAFGGNTIAASSATTYTRYVGANFTAPSAGTNVTMTSAIALAADNVSIGGAIIGSNVLAVTGQITNTGGTITTSQPLTITQTWNAAGVTFGGVVLNVTPTASASAVQTGSKIFDVQNAGTSIFAINQTISGSRLTVDTHLSDGYMLYDSGGSRLFQIAPNGGLFIAGSLPIAFNSGSDLRSGSLDTFLTRGGAATLQFGAADVASGAVAQTLQVQSNTGASTAGPDWKQIASGGTTVGGAWIVQTKATTTAADAIKATPLKSIVLNNAAIATNATDGFLYIATCAGTPTGTPTTFTGRVAMVYDTTNHQFWIFDGSWLQPKTPAAAALVNWQ